MFSNVLYSAQGDDDTIFIFYNQGCLSNDELDAHPDEPCMAPAILNGFGGYSIDPDQNLKIQGQSLNDAMTFLQEIKVDEIVRGFCHPIVHNSKILKDVGGIDLRFLRGNQGFKDYAILISYYNYMGTKNNWYPKINGNSTVFHNLVTQRGTVDAVMENISINEEGLYQQFGAYGFKVLSELLQDNEYTGKIYEYRVANFMNATLSLSDTPIK